MNADQLITILKTLKSQAASGAWDTALASLAPSASSSASSPAPAASAALSSPPDAPKKVLSEEQKAKMKAGREAAKAKKQADAEEAAKKHLKFDDEPEATAEAEKPKKAPRAASAWALFCQRVGAELKKADLKLGEPLSVASHVAEAAGVKESKAYDSVTAEQILAAAASYVPKPKEPKAEKAPKPKKAAKAATVSVAADDDVVEVVEAAEAAEAPKKRVLSEEHKAKLKAGREAAKAKKAAATVVEKPATAAAASPAEADAVLIDGESYVVLSNGAAYRHDGLSTEGQVGAYAGIYKDGVLDMTAEEPK